MLLFELPPLPAPEISGHLCSPKPVTNLAFQTHCFLLGFKSLTRHTNKVQPFDFFAYQAVAILVDCDVAAVAIDNLVMLLIVIIPTN
jgi:hypothetical protein